MAAALAATRTGAARALTSSSGSAPIEEVDVAVVGGGMVGLATAALLAQEPLLAGHRVLLLETGAEPMTQPAAAPDAPYSNRVVALSPASVDALEQLDAWRGLAGRTQPVQRMHVWEACSRAFISLARDAAEPMAHVVEVSALTRTLHESASLVGNLELRWKQRVVGIDFEAAALAGQGALLQLADGRRLAARLVVGADGAGSPVRTWAGLHAVQWTHGRGLVATLEADPEAEDAPSVAWQRFLPRGPVALLPLARRGAYSLVWSTSAEEAAQLLAAPAEEFVARVNQAMSSNARHDPLTSAIDDALQQLLGGGGGAAAHRPPTLRALQSGAESRAAFPLGFLHASQYVGPRVALLGDAAHRMLPLAGQGVNLGFGDALCLARVLADASAEGADLGSLRHLRSYESERQAFVAPVLATIETLHRLYGSTAPPVVLARSLGLRLVHGAAPVKKALVDSACHGRLIFAA